MSFADRLRQLIGNESVSKFARKVQMSESLIRKYLNGSEPSLSKANQIASVANCSLEWLATGEGYQYRKAEVVDMEALEIAIRLSHEQDPQSIALAQTDERSLKLIVSIYQFLRSTKKSDGYFELAEARQFANYLAGLCCS